MKILPYKLARTNDKLTATAGLLSVAQLMETLQLSERADQLLPQPKSNRGFKPSVYLQTFLLMHHEGSFHLDDVRHLSDDDALRAVMGLKTIPTARSLGAWLRRMGNDHKEASFSGLCELNKVLLSAALHRRREVTMDIDATEVISNKAEVKWTYNKNRGYMPMVGHIAETGQVVGRDFREGNASPA
jgi:hypothetical protein